MDPLVWIFFYELHYNTSCRFDDFLNQKIILQTDCLDLLSVFRFRENTPQTIPDMFAHELMVAAVQAPSAGDQKPWYFILVTESIRLNALVSKLSYGQNIQVAPACLWAVLGYK